MIRTTAFLLLAIAGSACGAVASAKEKETSPGQQVGDALTGVDKLVFVKRYTYHSSHFYTDFIDGVGNFGGNLCILDRKTSKVTDLLPRMKDGIFGRFDLSFDARRIVFDFKKAPREGFRIYEVGNDEKLPLEAFVKLATWVDANAVYYGSYWGRHQLEYKDHPNFRPVPTFEQAISTVAPLPENER